MRQISSNFALIGREDILAKLFKKRIKCRKKFVRKVKGKKYGSLEEKIYKSGSQAGDMKILVTGGAGFIRRGIVKRLCGRII